MDPDDETISHSLGPAQSLAAQNGRSPENQLDSIQHQASSAATSLQDASGSAAALSSADNPHHHNRLLFTDQTTRNSQQEQQDDLAATASLSSSSSWSLFSSINGSVNLNQVRNLIAQNLLELILVFVIIIYLVYYFSRVSKRPKLIGKINSKFVKFISSNLNETITSRFSPLIYFWGTNPQTCLFGYLQGQTSDHEVPRNKFKRQYLYVNDAQYLASNVDLSQYYNNLKNNNNNNNNNDTRPNKHKLVQLDVGQLLLLNQQQQQHQQTKPSCDNKQQSEEEDEDQTINCNRQSLLDRNIRLALNNIFNNKKANTSEDEGTDEQQHQHHHHQLRRHRDYCSSVDEEDIDQQSSKSSSSSSSSSTSPSSSVSSTTRTRAKKSHHHHHQNQLNRLSSIDCSNSSSADSGVFASASRSHSTASSSSTSSLTIDMSSISDSTGKQLQHKATDNKHAACNCSLLYETDMHQYLDDEKTILESGKNNAMLTPPTSNNEQQQQHQQEFGQCALDWYRDSHANYHKNKLVALISAGMTTGSDKKYVTDTVQTLDKLGYEVCVFIRRGVGGLKLSSTRFFSPSKWRDFEAAISSVKKQRPDSRLVAIGFSFGSIELCRYLSMSGQRSQVDAALLVSCPFDPEAGGRNMRKRALNRKIDAYLAKNLGKQLYQALSSSSSTADSDNSIGQTAADDVIQSDNNTITLQQQQQKFCNLNGSIVDLSSLPKIKSLVDFEDNFNRIIQNYPNSEAYADDSRLSEHLINIKTPTLCLSSEDDFMAPIKLLPIKQIEANENLCMILTKRGGHMAFIDGLVWPKKPYFAQRIIGKYMLAMRDGKQLLLN